MNGVIYTTNNVDEIIHVSGIAAYASGQAISNQSNIAALNTASGIATSLLAVSGTATSLVASSGIATYASGNTANISFGSNAEGDILIHNGSKFTRLAKGTDNYILKMNGNVPNWEAESGGGGSSLTAGSGVVVDGADKINIYGGTGNLQEIQLTSDNIFTPKMVFTGSGVQDTPITLKILSSHESASGSGTALSFEGTQGPLFSVTDNLSTGNIFSVNDITGLPLISVHASGEVKLAEYGKSVTVSKGLKTPIKTNTDGSTVTFDLDASNTHHVILGGNRTLALSNVDIGQKFLLRLQQDNSGNRTVTWFDHISWAGGSVPTLTTAANKADLLGFLVASGTGSSYWFDGLVVGQNI
jgi:hypothetical protein